MGKSKKDLPYVMNGKLDCCELSELRRATPKPLTELFFFVMIAGQVFPISLQDCMNRLLEQS